MTTMEAIYGVSNESKWIYGVSSGVCDFCNSGVLFDKWTDGVFNWQRPQDSRAGSDYLAIWCEKCGPKHRR